ncbi:protein kinase domain-containing protein [Engelhardtia mirabilis]|uniref:Serine/threonine-protein kinase PknB n=1 Tax=Engelhardtia mirabilis TaxID=2528011 RepID=A0A518BGV3_9BACT|nr:Serine/threonine-protein kinase PknB [Planctomycetes bacterium Pla133]QDV00511.1 Serine/threonine-protein kinase PknB [Planctomycetes bacterium Pla86]
MAKHTDDGAPPPSFLERALAVAFDSESRSGCEPGLGLPSGAGEVRPPVQVGRFLILGEIARGGGGVVHLAHDPDLERDVALKILRAGPHEAAQARDRFRREVLVSGRLAHPCFVPVHECGTTVDGDPFYVMRLVQGRTLTQLLFERAGGREPSAVEARASQRRLLVVLEQVAQAVGSAHAQGLVHRDLKPSNVMVGAFGEVQVMDWGVAKLLDQPEADPPLGSACGLEPGREPAPRPDSPHSLAGRVMGTPWYMPPEQARGEVELMDERSDVFALGALLCEILTGEPPFRGDRVQALRSARAGELQPALLALRNCGAEPELLSLAQSSLAEHVTDRPRDAMAFANALTAHFALQDETARRAEVAAAAARVEAREERRRRKLGLALAGAVLVALATAGAGLWVRHQDELSRVERRSAAVQGAHDSALASLARAQATGQEDPSTWDLALLEAEQAGRLLNSGEVRAGLAEQVLDLRDRARAGAERAHEVQRELDRDRLMLDRLERVRVPMVRSDFANAHADLAAAFASYGLALESPIPPAARESAIATQLANALGQWALYYFVYSGRPGDERGDFANRMLERGNELDPDLARVAIRDAIRARDRGALESLAAADASLDFAAPTFALLGGGLRIVGALDQAEATYERALSVHPGDCWLNHEFAQLLADRGDERTPEALEHAFAALGSCGGTWGARHLLGGLLRREDRMQDALEQFEALARVVPNDGHIRSHIADCLLDLGRGWDALESARHALELAPEDSHAWHVLARIEQSRGRRRAQVEAARRSFEADPDSLAMARALGKSLFFVDHYEEAIALYEGFLVEDVEGVESERERIAESDRWMKYGLLMGRVGEREASVRALRTAIRFDPSNAFAHCNLGMALEERGDFAGAGTSYRRGHELGSAQPAWSVPTEAWASGADRLLHLAARLDAFEGGLWQPDPDLDAYLLALAASYSQRHPLAVRAYEQALVRVPDLAAEAGAEYRRSLAGSAAAACQLGGLRDGERVAYAQRALDWLSEDLEGWQLELRTDPQGSFRAASTALRRMQSHRSYEDVRGEAQLDALRALGEDGERVAARALDLWAAIGAEVDSIVAMELEWEAARD